MTNILFSMAIGIAMSAAILGAYRWMVWHGYILMPSRRVRELVNEYARLKAELKDAETEERGKAIWDRMRAIDLELAEINYVLIETARAAYVFPIDDYHVATFGKAPAHRTGATWDSPFCLRQDDCGVQGDDETQHHHERSQEQ